MSRIAPTVFLLGYLSSNDTIVSLLRALIRVNLCTPATCLHKRVNTAATINDRFRTRSRNLIDDSTLAQIAGVSNL